MSDLSIGLSGLDVALKAIATVGNNIANAATPGYHRQEIDVAPMPSDSGAALEVGNGAQVLGVRRLIDRVLEAEIFRQQPLLGQAEEELSVLQAVEGVLADLSAEGAGPALDRFFAALRELVAQPEDASLRTQAIWAADALAAQFRNLAEALAALDRSLDVEIAGALDQANGLALRIADLNAQLQATYYRRPDNNVLDMRDQAVLDLARLVGIETQDAAGGAITVRAAGTALVTLASTAALEAGLTPDGRTAVGVEGSGIFDAQVTGGRLGALLALKNDILPAVRQALDAVAREVIFRINREHAQAVGTAGSFTRLVSRAAADDLAEWDAPLAAGTIYVRVINAATGAAARYAVAVDPESADPAESTLAGIAGQFDAIDGLRASVSGGRMTLQADTGYRFDFLPALLPDPAAVNMTGTARPTISGLYTGSATQVFTARAVGSGEVGVTDGLAVEVLDAGGSVVATLSVGLGYAAGDVLDIGDGIRAAFSRGSLVVGDSFTILAPAEADASGFLAAAELNAFFTGNSAASMQVSADLRDAPERLATALTPAATDNRGARRMADVADTAAETLGGLTIGDAYRSLAADVGRQVAVRSARVEALQQSNRLLTAQRDEATGVDINEEAAKLIIFQQLFQSMAKYLATVRQTNETLFDIV
ncbi:MAG: flagellar hook-associated protein FlgK [Planctomycetes bacterium]|nr:flagellar hook-associated protein FlgK [Planctomycetota bacterium]